MMTEKISNYIVLGAGGFLGKHLSDKLYQPGVKLALFGDEIDEQRYADATVCNGLIADFNELDEFISGSTCIYYLINTISPTLEDHDLILNDLGLFVKFLSWVSKHQNVKVVYTSSGGTIYKQGLKTPINEEQAVEPISYYGMAKLSAENYLKLFAHKYDIHYTIVRISNPYGIGQPFKRNQGLIPMICSRLAEGEPITIYGDGSMVRDYIYISDLIEALYFICQTEDTRNETLNLGYGKGVSILEVVETVESNLMTSAEKVFVEDNNSLVKSNILSIDKAKSMLNWSPQITFSEGIKLLCESLHK